MGIDVSQLEPAERDPLKLRKTAWTIISIALVGGFIVLLAYRMKTSDEPERPPIVTRLKSNFAAVNYDGETVDLGQLEGGIWLATVIALEDQERSRDSIRVMKELEASYPPGKISKFVCFTIDPNNDRPPKLAEFAREQGLTSDRWWLLAAGEKPIRGYIKDRLLLGTVVDQAVDGKRVLEFPSVIAIIDQHRHLRGRYDFNQARSVVESAEKLLRDEPERSDEFFEDFGKRPEEFLEEEQKLRAHLEHAINYILTEDLENQ